jgi:hypothetical protein
MSTKQLLQQAYEVGILVAVIDDNYFVTAPVLAAPCVRCTEEGLRDVIARMRVYYDKRPSYARARDSGMHLRLVNLMKAHKPFANECAMLIYHCEKRMIRDLRIPHRYTEAARAAERALASADRHA